LADRFSEFGQSITILRFFTWLRFGSWLRHNGIPSINAGLPADTWENVPTDGSINLDHYLYEAPQQQP